MAGIWAASLAAWMVATKVSMADYLVVWTAVSSDAGLAARKAAWEMMLAAMLAAKLEFVWALSLVDSKAACLVVSWVVPSAGGMVVRLVAAMVVSKVALLAVLKADKLADLLETLSELRMAEN